MMENPQRRLSEMTEAEREEFTARMMAELEASPPLRPLAPVTPDAEELNPLHQAMMEFEVMVRELRLGTRPSPTNSEPPFQIPSTPRPSLPPYLRRQRLLSQRRPSSGYESDGESIDSDDASNDSSVSDEDDEVDYASEGTDDGDDEVDYQCEGTDNNYGPYEPPPRRYNSHSDVVK